MAERSGRIDIFIKIINSIVLVAIPIVISYWGGKVSEAMERGRLVDTLIEDLTNIDTRSRRDIALLALHDAVPVVRRCRILGLFSCHEIDEDRFDMVFEVATVLYSGLQNAEEGKYVIRVMRERKPERLTEELLASLRPRSTLEANRAYTASAIAPGAGVPGAAEVLVSDTLQADQVSRAAEAFALAVDLADPPRGEALATPLEGVEIVFIQYRQNRQTAERIRQQLLEFGVTVPGIEKVSSIRQNDIRYAGASEEEAARALSTYLRQEGLARIATFINLADANYSVPAGQFEIWLND